MNSEDEQQEDALIRRRFDEWAFKGIVFLVPTVMSIAVWSFNLQTRIETIATKQEERGPRLAAIERDIDTLTQIARDPSPRPEAKIALDGLRADHKRVEDRLDRLEERINGLHQFIINAPLKLMPGRRGALPPFKPETENAG